MRIKHTIAGMAFVVLALLFSGCEEEEKYQLRFSHYLHVQDMEMACGDCHGEPGQPSFNAITHETCIDCHDEPEAEEITVDTCGICHAEKQVAGFVLPETEEGDATSTNMLDILVQEANEAEAAAEPEPAMGIFVHTEALAEKCTDCHDYLMNEDLETVPVLTRDDIVAIRNKAHISGQDCNTCHVGLDPAIPPASHDMAWAKRHGLFAMQDDASCSVCHTQDSCMDCHSVMQPVSHNNMFRMRTHGIIAATDRASCQVCHEEDSCTSCHASTRPRSHNARWAASGKKPTHCIGCHTDTAPGQGCVVCHESGNDLLLHQQYWPSDHNTVPVVDIGCYQCHWINTP